MQRNNKSNRKGGKRKRTKFAFDNCTDEISLCAVFTLEISVIHRDNTHFGIIRHHSSYHLIGEPVCLLFIFLQRIKLNKTLTWDRQAVVPFSIAICMLDAFHYELLFLCCRVFSHRKSYHRLHEIQFRCSSIISSRSSNGNSYVIWKEKTKEKEMLMQSY